MAERIDSFVTEDVTPFEGLHVDTKSREVSADVLDVENRALHALQAARARLAHATAHRELMPKPSDFRVKNLFTQWKRTAPSQPQGDDQHQGPTTEPHSEVAASAPPGPPPPPPALPPPPMQSPPPQGLEQMDDERARKRAAERAESSSVTVVWMTRAERALDRPDRSDFILLRAVWR